MGPTLHLAGAGPQRVLVELKHLEWANQIFQIKLHLDLLSCLISQARIIYIFLSRTGPCNLGSTDRLYFILATKDSLCWIMKLMKNSNVASVDG